MTSTIIGGLGVAPAAAQQATLPDLSTFPYLPQRKLVVGDGLPYNFDPQLPALADRNARDLFEFNANWGNRAIGQAAALNATETRPRSPGSAVTVDGLTGRGVVVAVIDSGIDAQFKTSNPQDGFVSIHPEFAGRLDIRSRAFPEGAAPSLDIADTNGHGTHVAGTIAAARDGIGMMGIAPDATLVVLKAIGKMRNGGDTDEDAAVNYAASLSDVRIINGSYGPQLAAGDKIWKTENLRSEYDAVSNALSKGKILVFSNGNDGAREGIGDNPLGIALFPYIKPSNANKGIYDDGGARYDFSALDQLNGKIVAVANLNASLTIAASSNRCGVAARWCVSAPGGGDWPMDSRGAVLTTDPGLILSTYPRDKPNANLPDQPEGRNYSYLPGTSMAAPHVSGALAVLAQAYPDYSAKELVQVLFSTAQDLGAPGIDAVYGHGLIRLDRALSAPLINPDTSNTVSVAAGRTQYAAAPITTSGDLTLAGAGRDRDTGSKVVMAGRAIVGGTVRADNIDVEVDGTLVTPRLTIAPNAALSGEGDILGDVEVRGLFAPGSGNSGDLVVHGNLALAKESQFLAIVDGSDFAEMGLAYSVAVVSGAGHSFTAAGQLVFGMFGMPTGTVVAPIGSKFPVVLAEDGARIRGRFDSVGIVAEDGPTGLPSASRIDLLYRPDAILGAVTPASYGRLEANGVAMTGRQRAVGAALDRARGAPGDAMSERALDLFDPLFGLGAEALPRTFDQLSGAGSSAAAVASVEDARRFSGLIGQRLSALRSGTAGVQGRFAPSLATATSGAGGLFVSPTSVGPARFSALDGAPGPALARPAQPAGAGIWGLGFGSGLQIGQDSSGPGLRARGGGVAFGADRALDTNLLLGGAFGYARSGVTAAGVRGNADTFLGAAYLGYQRGGFEVDASAGLAYAVLDTTRSFQPFDTVQTARQKTDGIGALASVEAGYRFSLPVAATVLDLKPLAGFSYNDLHRGAFTEIGRYGLGFAAQTFGRATTLVGAAAGFDLEAGNGLRIRPELRLGWTHDLVQASSLVTATLLDQRFQVRDARPGRDGLLVEANVSLWSSESVSLFAGYRGEHRARGSSNQGHAGLRITW